MRRGDRLPEGEPWVLVADVLAEAAGQNPSRSFDLEARAQAKTMRGVRHDWAGRPQVTWSVAAELLASLKAERARVVAAQQARVAAGDAQRMVPAGVVQLERPGEPVWTSPTMARNPYQPPERVEVPG